MAIPTPQRIDQAGVALCGCPEEALLLVAARHPGLSHAVGVPDSRQARAQLLRPQNI